MTTIRQIEEWYRQQCNGEWEHTYGVKIDTLDNPGWCVKIDLTMTDLENEPFSAIKKGVGSDGQPSESDWICCSVQNKVFDGAGDPSKLDDILRTFLDWKEQRASQPSQSTATP